MAKRKGFPHKMAKRKGFPHKKVIKKAPFGAFSISIVMSSSGLEAFKLDVLECALAVARDFPFDAPGIFTEFTFALRFDAEIAFTAIRDGFGALDGASGAFEIDDELAFAVIGCEHIAAGFHCDLRAAECFFKFIADCRGGGGHCLEVFERFGRKLDLIFGAIDLDGADGFSRTSGIILDREDCVISSLLCISMFGIAGICGRAIAKVP